jgi:hypothetical protein
VGVIFYNSFAGRSGEWEQMLRSDVLQQASSDYILCKNHKTAWKYGSLAKYIPPGSMKAFVTFCQIPKKHSELFIEPATVGCERLVRVAFSGQVCTKMA